MNAKTNVNRDYKKSLTKQILDVTDVPSFLEKQCGLKVQKTNGSAIFCCPFHADRNPSFAIYLNSGAGKCFSCGETADLVKIFYQIRACSSVVDACSEIIQLLGLGERR